MKLTKSKLKQIIREELENIQAEGFFDFFSKEEPEEELEPEPQDVWLKHNPDQTRAWRDEQRARMAREAEARRAAEDRGPLKISPEDAREMLRQANLSRSKRGREEEEHQRKRASRQAFHDRTGMRWSQDTEKWDRYDPVSDRFRKE